MTLSFNRNPISTPDFESDRFYLSNFNRLKSESSTIQFVGPNRLSLLVALQSGCPKSKCSKTQMQFWLLYIPFLDNFKVEWHKLAGLASIVCYKSKNFLFTKIVQLCKRSDFGQLGLNWMLHSCLNTKQVRTSDTTHCTQACAEKTVCHA